jgi:hypothetical protein
MILFCNSVLYSQLSDNWNSISQTESWKLLVKADCYSVYYNTDYKVINDTLYWQFLKVGALTARVLQDEVKSEHGTITKNEMSKSGSVKIFSYDWILRQTDFTTSDFPLAKKMYDLVWK